MYTKKEVEIGGRSLSFETGKMAKQTSGSVVVSCGDTIVTGGEAIDRYTEMHRFSV